MFADGVGGVSSGRVKFHLAGGAQPIILVPVHVNDEGPFDFVLDTGAGTSLLVPAVAKSLKIETSGAKEAQTAGGKVAVALGRVRSLSLGDCRLSDVEVGMVDLSHIARTVGANIDGDLGYNFLRHFRLMIDYRANELRLHDPRRFDYGGAGALTEVPMRLAAAAKPLILLDTFVDGHGPFQFALDTGTSTTAISAGLASRLSIRATAMGPATTGGAHVELGAGKVNSLQVGGAKIQDLAVVIGPFLAILSEAAGVALDGIIGYNFLRHYKVTIDYPNLVLSLFSP
jgi:predicted aspartyl protease